MTMKIANSRAASIGFRPKGPADPSPGAKRSAAPGKVLSPRALGGLKGRANRRRAQIARSFRPHLRGSNANPGSSLRFAPGLDSIRPSGERSRRGFTLTELLVVISIIVLLVVIAIPVVGPSLRDRKVREASRTLNGFIVGAQSAAAGTGRPHGIWLERLESDPEKCIQVFRAEVSPPYAGDTMGARVRGILPDTSTPGADDYIVYFDTFASLLTATPPLVRPGDRIKFDYRQPLYDIISLGTATGGSDPPATIPGYKLNIRLRSLSDSPPVGAGSTSLNVPYQIYRQPTKSFGNSLEMPADMMIDLANSGIGPTGREFVFTELPPPASTRPIVIMFSPSGAIDEIYSEQLVAGNVVFQSAQPRGAVHLLIGKFEQGQLAPNNDPTDAASATPNLADVTNLWVSIGHRTGNVSSTENADINVPGPPANPVAKARQFAREKHAMGGR